MVITILVYVIATACLLTGVMVLRGSNPWSRLLGFALVGNKVNMLIIVLALRTGHSYYLDIALVYTLLGYIGVLVISQYLASRTQATLEADRENGGQQ